MGDSSIGGTFAPVSGSLWEQKWTIDKSLIVANFLKDCQLDCQVSLFQSLLSWS